MVANVRTFQYFKELNNPAIAIGIMLPYNKGLVSEVSKALFLKKFGVPFWVLAFVFGHTPMWWYRLYLSLGHYDLVGTIIYEPEDLPINLIADEHHIMVKGEKKYVATTVANGCFLGMSVCDGADEASLQAGYQEFKDEALLVNPDYEPETVNTLFRGMVGLQLNPGSYRERGLNSLLIFK